MTNNKNEMTSNDMENNKTTVVKTDSSSTHIMNEENSFKLNEQEDDNKDKSNEDTELDEEGLNTKKGYDVIICGTNLINSILACAISLTGRKSILQVDGNFYYGDYDCNFTSLNDFNIWCQDILKKQQHQAGGVHADDDIDLEDNAILTLTDSEYISLNRNGGLSDLYIHSYSGCSDNDGAVKDFESINISIGMEVFVVSFNIIGTIINIQNDNNNTIEIELTSWTLANGKHPIIYIPRDQTSSPTSTSRTMKEYNKKLKSMQEIYYKETQKHKLNRQFIIDISTNLVLYANGSCVDGLLSSNVSNYLEFQSIPSLYLLHSNKDELDLLKVPCTKSDVFSSKDLNPMDKRKIMKLSQFALDYGLMKHYQDDDHDDNDNNEQKEVEESSHDTTTTTEVVTTLNEVRLKTGRSLIRPQNKTTISIEEYKELSLQQNQHQSFEDFIVKKYKLKTNISKYIVQYVLGLSMDNKETFGTCIDTIFYHLNSLGRFGNTAFLCPLYGCNDILQSFCRSSAVHGSISLLRRCPLRILCNTDQKEATGIILKSDPDPIFTLKTKDKIIPCKNIIVSSQSINIATKNDTNNNKRILKRIIVLRSNNSNTTNYIMNNYSRCIFIIPPNTLDNNYAIQGILLDSTLHVTPMHYFVLHLTTIIDTSSSSSSNNLNTISDDVLRHATNHIIQKICTKSSYKIYEIHSLSYSVNHPPTKAQQEEYQSKYLPKNVYPTYRSSLCNITLDEAFYQAHNIFNKICPNDDFLIISNYLKEKINKTSMFGSSSATDGEKDNNDDDDENHLLDSAFQSMFVKNDDDGDDKNDDGDEKNDDGDDDDKSNSSGVKENE